MAGVLKVFFVFKSLLFTESAIMVRSSVPATLKPHLEEESSIISVTTKMVGRFFYWNGRKMHLSIIMMMMMPVQCHKCYDQELPTRKMHYHDDDDDDDNTDATYGGQDQEKDG